MKAMKAMIANNDAEVLVSMILLKYLPKKSQKRGNCYFGTRFSRSNLIMIGRYVLLTEIRVRQNFS